MTKRPIGPVDNLWLGMDTPENLMVIDGVLWFDQPLDTEAAIQVLDERLPGRYPVFRQHPVSTRDPRYHAMWADDDDFDIQEHVIETELAAPGSKEQLQSYIDSIISRPLDSDRSPWEVHLIHGFGAGSAMYIRLHHAMADGTALARVILELTEDATVAPEPTPKLTSTPTETDTGVETESGTATETDANPDTETDLDTDTELTTASLSLTDQIFSQVFDLAKETQHFGVSMFHQISAAATPHNYPDIAHLLSGTGQTAFKLLSTTLPQTILSGSVQTTKNARWSDPISLATVKTIAHAHNATVNDVLMSVLAGAMSRYVVERGQEPADVSTMVPVNLRPLDQPLPRELGNKFALVLLELPLSAQTPVDRLIETKRRMDAIKDSPEAILTFGTITALGTFNPAAARIVIDFFSNKAVGITTNVPGPRTGRMFAGIPVSGVVGWAPGAGTQSLNACIFSLNGEITVGFKSDATVFTDPAALLSAFDQELEALIAS